MRDARTTPNGRRLTAEPVPRGEPDMDRLVALVLHLADRLHAQTPQPEPDASSMMRTTDHDDHRRHDDPGRPGRGAGDGGDLSAGLHQGTSHGRWPR